MEEAFPAQANERDSQRLDRSTQTDPGVWTPGLANKRGDEANSQALGSSPGKVNMVLYVITDRITDSKCYPACYLGSPNKKDL